MTDWDYSFRALQESEELSAADREYMANNAREYGEWIGCHVGQVDAVTPTGVPSGPCGLCAIPELHHGGVHSLKVIGREAPAYKKLRSVQQVRAVMGRVVDGESAEDCRVVAQAIRGTPDLCRSGFGCYYPEVVRGEAGSP